MSITRQKFVDVADKIFSKFEDFISPAIFDRGTNVNRQTGVRTPDTQTVRGIQTKFDEKIFGNTHYKAGDYVMVFKYKDFSWLPEIGMAHIEMNGVKSEIVDRSIDPAFATITFHVRRL